MTYEEIENKNIELTNKQAKSQSMINEEPISTTQEMIELEEQPQSLIGILKAKHDGFNERDYQLIFLKLELNIAYELGATIDQSLSKNKSAQASLDAHLQYIKDLTKQQYGILRKKFGPNVDFENVKNKVKNLHETNEIFIRILFMISCDIEQCMNSVNYECDLGYLYRLCKRDFDHIMKDKELLKLLEIKDSDNKNITKNDLKVQVNEVVKAFLLHKQKLLYPKLTLKSYDGYWDNVIFWK